MDRVSRRVCPTDQLVATLRCDKDRAGGKRYIDHGMASCADARPKGRERMGLSDRTIEEILAERPEAARAFLRRKMACVGCGMARFDTLGEAARIYGVPEAELLAEIERTGSHF